MVIVKHFLIANRPGRSPVSVPIRIKLYHWNRHSRGPIESKFIRSICASLHDARRTSTELHYFAHGIIEHCGVGKVATAANNPRLAVQWDRYRHGLLY